MGKPARVSDAHAARKAQGWSEGCVVGQEVKGGIWSGFPISGGEATKKKKSK